MKIAFITPRYHSGSDVYFRLLKSGLDRYSDIESELFFLPSFLELLPPLIPRYLKEIDAGDYDIIHTGAEFGHYFKMEGKGLYVTVLHSVFDETYQRYTSVPQKIFHRLWIRPNMEETLRQADRICAISHYTKSQAENYFSCAVPIDMIHNGIDVHRFGPVPPPESSRPVRLLFVGNTTRRKGFDLLPSIMERLGPRFVLSCTGGMRNSRIRSLPGNMVSLGRLCDKDLIAAYRHSDILIFPSRLEGFGYSLCEAMACGLPVVATDCSSIPEIIVHEKGGFLCALDDVNDFVSRIGYLAAHPQLRREMGSYNRERVENLFSQRRMIEQYVTFYNEFRSR